MTLNITQTKLVGLTMELDLKARDYKALCEKVDKLKEDGIDENDEKLIDIRDEFQKNYNDIVEIKRKLNELKLLQIKHEEEIKEKYSRENLFKLEENKNEIINENNSLAEVKKDNFFVRILEKIKMLIKGKR